MKEQKLKPVIFTNGLYNYNRADLFKQNLILKALEITSDPKKLKELVGVRSVAEVYRTLDKMAIRKEYHEALVRQGIDLDYIVKGIKGVCEDSGSPAVQLGGHKTLLKSLGLDEYKDDDGVSRESWEDMVRKMVESGTGKCENKDYEVIEPPIPEKEKKAIAEEKERGKSLYE